MELYIPSLAVILLALVVIGILSKVNSTALFVIVVVIFILTAYQHANLFTNEYAYSTWQNMTSGSSNYIIISIVVLMMIGFLLNLVRSGSTAATSYTNAATPPLYGMNTLKSMIRDPFKTR